MLLSHTHSAPAEVSPPSLRIAGDYIAPADDLVPFGRDKMRPAERNARKDKLPHALKRRSLQHCEKHPLAGNRIERIAERMDVTFADLADNRHGLCQRWSCQSPDNDFQPGAILTARTGDAPDRSEEHTSELQSLRH